MSFDRRMLLRNATYLAALAGLTPSRSVLATGLGTNPFTLGVAAGDPWPDGFVIWTRLAPDPLAPHGGMPAQSVPVGWEVAEDEAFSKIARKGQSLARPELGHSVHVELSGLEPHRHYWYRFHVAGSDVSPVGRARTAPPATAPVDRVRIGVAGCQNWEIGYYDAYRALAQENDLDLVFHYGDYIYEAGPRPLGGPIVRQHLGETLYSLDDYRRRYAQYKMDPDLQAAHHACAFAMSFDDHEVNNNWAGEFDQAGTPPEIFALRRFAGLQAWYENVPVRRAQMPRPGGITAYRRLDYGRLLRTHVLDTRSYRTDQPCSDDPWSAGCTPQVHNSPSMLGSVQEAWLDEGLGNGATWNLLAQQVIMMQLDFREPGTQEPIFQTDLWDGYRPARARVIESIRRHGLTNVVVSSGDHHKHAVGSVALRDDDPAGEKVAVEFLATSISSGGDGGGEKASRHLLSNNPNLDLYHDKRGYQVFDITPKRWTTDVRILDHVSAKGAPASTLACYEVRPESPRVQRIA
ncbi:alkaline phosphatase D family protein [Novosphingobium profundi]|uniref:alkaline phosphatase D family protein n=1 Tax=Novosphingobium profundi TaxID=1774954 RepID=UPI001BDA77B2|nr:alkaline phosphatase D family protein [Novosphingobium profundi]MBT0670250.1 alkaline phosphatase D family protein [Novosphingobium profundi]